MQMHNNAKAQNQILRIVKFVFMIWVLCLISLCQYPVRIVGKRNNNYTHWLVIIKIVKSQEHLKNPTPTI